MEEFKKEYNYLLHRYYNGCKYISENLNECDKLIGPLLEILNKLNNIVEKHSEMTIKEILEGFDKKV